MTAISAIKILGITDAKIGYNSSGSIVFQDVPFANNFTMSNASTQITFEGDATSEKVFSDNELSGTLVHDKLSPTLLEKLYPGKENIDAVDGFPINPIVTIGTPGTGYTTVPAVSFAAAPAGGRRALGHATIGAGAVTGIVVDDAGAGYLVAPAIAITGGGGASAAATCVLAALPGGSVLRVFGGDDSEFAQASVELVVTAAGIAEYADNTSAKVTIVYTIPKANISPLQLGNLANRAKQTMTYQWTAVKTLLDIVGGAIMGQTADGCTFYLDVIS